MRGFQLVYRIWISRKVVWKNSGVKVFIDYMWGAKSTRPGLETAIEFIRWYPWFFWNRKTGAPCTYTTIDTKFSYTIDSVNPSWKSLKYNPDNSYWHYIEQIVFDYVFRVFIVIEDMRKFFNTYLNFIFIVIKAFSLKK